METITLVKAADCALAAYRGSKECALTYLDEVDRFENADTSTAGFVGSAGPLVVVSFAGTKDLKDWMTDVDCALETIFLPGGYAVRVHRGFYRAYESVSRTVQELIQKKFSSCRLKVRKLVFTGHSLGGALAVIAALACKVQDADYRIITFGAPRVGDWCLSSLLGPYTVRVVARGDKVPSIPWIWTPWRPSVFYSHVGKSLIRGFYLPGIYRTHSMLRYHALALEIQAETEMVL